MKHLAEGLCDGTIEKACVMFRNATASLINSTFLNFENVHEILSENVIYIYIFLYKTISNCSILAFKRISRDDFWAASSVIFCFFS